jgi:polyisoprenoid-binding protein YceI
MSDYRTSLETELGSHRTFRANAGDACWLRLGVGYDVHRGATRLMPARRLRKNLRTFQTRCLGAVLAPAVGLLVGFSYATARPLQYPPPIASPEFVLTLDPAQSTVHWTVDSTLHAVHGTFVLTRGTVRFDPETGKASGEIVVSAQSGESGDRSRDARMHKEILESAKYPEVIFRPTQIEGPVARSGASDVKLLGIFSIHGSDHDLTALVHVEISPDRWKGGCTFDVPYIAWGIKNPSNFLLKVKPVVNVEMETAGSIQTPK